MALPTSGVLDFNTIRNYTVILTTPNSSWGNYNATTGAYLGGAISYGQPDLGYYRGRKWYKAGPTTGNFPSTNLSLDLFYGASPYDEWNCACQCDCGGGK